MKFTTKVSLKWKNRKKFQSSTFDTVARRRLVESRHYAGIYCSGNSHVTCQPVSFPLHPIPGGMLSRSQRIDGPSSIWNTHGMFGNVFVGEGGSPVGLRWVSGGSLEPSSPPLTPFQTPFLFSLKKKKQKRQNPLGFEGGFKGGGGLNQPPPPLVKPFSNPFGEAALQKSVHPWLHGILHPVAPISVSFLLKPWTL